MRDFFAEIWEGLRRNRLRTALTGVAVAWGIFMLIVLLGAGNGLINAFLSNSSSLVYNTVTVYPGFTSVPYDGLSAGRRIRYTADDLQAVRDRFRHRVEQVEGTVSRSLTYSSPCNYENCWVQGVYPGELKNAGIKMIEGRFISQRDIEERRKVTVLPQKTAQLLFKSASRALGKYVQAGEVALKVVGIFATEASRDESSCFMPFTTMCQIYNMGVYVNNLTITVRELGSAAAGDTFEAELRALLAQRHRYDANDRRACWVDNSFERAQEMNTAKRLLTTSLWVIGLFTLVSGVLGVSNIMLITVRERMHEFGVRKALGAKPRSILLLVMAESICVTAIFGYAGMFLGMLATEYLDVAAGSQKVDLGVMGEAVIFKNPTIDITVALQATLVLIIAGMLAGFFPARKAARVKPVEALRG